MRRQSSGPAIDLVLMPARELRFDAQRAPEWLPVMSMRSARAPSFLFSLPEEEANDEKTAPAPRCRRDDGPIA
jgi:hypothetical protein